MDSQREKINEENVDRDLEGMYWGVVYIYINTTPGPEYGWVYVGFTTNENGRRIKWLNIKCDYSGRKIKEARLRYGLDSFRYDILARVRCETVKELLVELKRLERYYINLYNSTLKGYNINGGGVGRPAVRVLIEDALGNTTRFSTMTEAGHAIGLFPGSVRYWIKRNRPTKKGGYMIKTA